MLSLTSFEALLQSLGRYQRQWHGRTKAVTTDTNTLTALAVNAAYTATNTAAMPLPFNNEPLFSLFMANSQFGYWIYDENNYVVFANTVYLQMFGFKENPTGKHLSHIFSPAMSDTLISINAEILKQGAGGIAEHSYTKADGSMGYFMFNSFLFTSSDKKKYIGGQAIDITDKKKLEQQLLNEQIKKQKLINQATIDAQEKERGMISAELHDNVNQLLMSARLHINAAKNNDAATELITKASDYLLTAVEEIRNLSHKLNPSIVKTVGLEPGIMDICHNMKLFNNIDVTAQIEQAVVTYLTPEQQLVIFRIVQEQSNNIIKYANAGYVTISLTDHGNYCTLQISDDGVGFDKTTQKTKGNGFINIFNRADAYNGKAQIITAPGKGCMVEVTLPYSV